MRGRAAIVSRGGGGGLRVEAGAVEPRKSVMAPEKRITWISRDSFYFLFSNTCPGNEPVHPYIIDGGERKNLRSGK